MRIPTLRLVLPAALIVFIAFACVSFLTRVDAQKDDTQQVSATFRNGSLSVAIPYHSAMKGPGHLILELLDPEDHVLGRSDRAFDITGRDGAFQSTLIPDKPIALDDLVWQRLRYRFEYTDSSTSPIEGIESVSEVLRRPVVRLIGQTQYLAGSEAALRVVVTDAGTSDAGASNLVQSGTIHIDLLVPGQSPQLLFTGSLNRRGTVEAQLHFPANLTGHVELRTVADTPIGSTEFTQPIELESKASILLTTEKPIYQPGQTIHIRALVLDRAAMKATAGPLTFEIEDSRGNKVFRKATATDAYGIASAEFSLADEVNLGTYHLRALMGDPDAPANTTEIALNVERYVLPKFKVAVEFTAKDGKPRRDYRPGDHVTGTVRANYFFGKPVDHAAITLKASAMDVEVAEAASASGKTDADGVYHFDLKLPSYFTGGPLAQGTARALVEATVTDSADHAETHGEPITVSDSALLVTAVPEGGTLIPHIDNQIFLLASYPDGTPATASLVIHTPPPNQLLGEQVQHVTTDASGIAVVHVNPGAGLKSLHIEATDNQGIRVSTNVPLQSRSGDDQVLLRASHAILKVGDRMQLKVLSTRATGAAYIDVVHDGQTILTRDVDLQNGEADVSIAVTPDMAGTLDLDAYLFGRDAQAVADHRLVFVQPADELKIETTTDAALYEPGADARINFHVTNARGQGVSAALGLQIVDEAVFALAEKQPGFAKVFFYLEQEAMKPRYEIHSLSMPGVIDSDTDQPNAPDDAARDLAAHALFSATEMAAPAKLDTEFGRSLPEQKYAEYRQRYSAAFNRQVSSLAGEAARQITNHSAAAGVMQVFEKLASTDPRARDAWGTPLRIESTGFRNGNILYYQVRSAGPDRQFNTADDLSIYLEDRSALVVAHPNRSGGSSDLRIEHDRGPVGDRAEVTGTVEDPKGAVIEGATVSLRELSSGSTRTTHADRTGQFTLAALPAGRYQAQITSLGFAPLITELTVQPRDRAILSGRLAIGATTDTVTVTSAAGQILQTESVLSVASAAPALRGRAAMPLPAPMMAQLSVDPEGNAAATVIGGNALNKLTYADVQDLALNGRDTTELLKVLPGVVAVSGASAASSTAPHVRSYFPEALYINPEIITDGHGNASISIPVADSITTWRVAMLASTQSGALGTGTSSLKVFQDFFVDLDLPITLTQGDRVSLPVAVYNYSGKRGNVSLQLQPDADSWYSLDNDTANKSLAVDSGAVGGSQFTLTANRIGKFKLTLSAHMGGVKNADRDDIVVREIEVVPNGREQDAVVNGTLDGAVQHTLSFPAGAIADASSVLVRLYPGPLSQVIEGMDSILQMPGGCFEQTSSSTYPNVLALDYMKRTKKITPEIHAKAEGYIANGYQRLLTFEVPGGGFSWFGQAPANKILTAYGLMEFNDMSKVSDVDARLIERTRDWLARQQQPDGSWKPDTQFINEGATNRFNTDVLRITAYVAWSLANTGYQGPAVEKAKSYIESRSSEKADPYTLAAIANFAVDYGRDRDFTARAMQGLIDARTEQGEQVSWTAEETGVYSTGQSAAIETTGLATQALLKWGQAPQIARKALTYLSSKKQASGNWGTTQATIMALRALLMATERGTSDVHGSLSITLNGKPVETLELNADNNDLLHQFVFKNIDPQQEASVGLKFVGSGALAYQIVGRSFVPWLDKPAAEPLSIHVNYDRTRLAQKDVATATATVENNLPQTANMVMVDLGIPPGFELLSEDLQAFQEKSASAASGRLEKFSLTATQAILYFNALGPRQTIRLEYRLRAKYPIRAHTFASRVYEYYDPDVQAMAQPIQLEVSE